MPDTEERPKN
jgi:hypothetical protein